MNKKLYIIPEFIYLSVDSICKFIDCVSMWTHAFRPQ